MPSAVSYKNHEVDIAIIGAGPGGLAVATQVMARDPTAKVVMYERYPEYQRHHTLHLTKSAFSGFPRTPAIQQLVDGLFEKPHGKFKKMSSILSQGANIKTSKIEGDFLKLAKEQQIEIRYETIDDPEEVAKRHPNAQFIVAADSSHSETRKRLFTEKMYLHENELAAILPLLQERDSSLTDKGLRELLAAYKIELKSEKLANLEPTTKMLEELTKRHQDKSAADFLKLALLRLSHEVVPHQEDYQYVAELKYEVKGEASELNLFTETYSTQVETEAFVTEHVGKTVNGVTPVTLRVLIEPEAYGALKDKATFKTPLTLDNPNVPKGLREAFSTWLNVRAGSKVTSKFKSAATEHEKALARQNVKLSVTKLQVYHSDDVVKVHKGRTYALVADAAAGVPFFTNFKRIGLPGSSNLANAIVKSRKPQGDDAKGVLSWLIKKVVSIVSWVFPSLAPVTPLERYQNQHRKIVSQEISSALTKNRAINLYKKWLKTAHTSKEFFYSPKRSFKKTLEFSKLAFGMASISDDYS